MLLRFDWLLSIALATLAYVTQLSGPAFARPAPDATNGNLTSILYWFTDKPTYHSINGEYSHEVTLEVNGMHLGKLKYDAGVFTNICHEYRDWCVTHSDPANYEFWIYYKGIYYHHTKPKR